MSSVRNLYASKIQNWRPSYYFFKIRAFSFFKTRILIFVSWKYKISMFMSSRHIYSPLKVRNWCAHARRGFFSPQNSDFVVFEHTIYHFCCYDIKIMFWVVSEPTFLRPLRTESGVGNSLADPPDPADPADSADPVHEPRLGTALPRAPGVRMTWVQDKLPQMNIQPRKGL